VIGVSGTWVRLADTMGLVVDVGLAELSAGRDFEVVDARSRPVALCWDGTTSVFGRSVRVSIVGKQLHGAGSTPSGGLDAEQHGKRGERDDEAGYERRDRVAVGDDRRQQPGT
jgi:hypothetical protein